MMKHNQNRLRSHKSQLGIGIVEVLVALVVVSLGVLGMASLQLTGMQQSTGGYNRAKALLYAENMATRMRTNRPAIDGNNGYLFDGFESTGLNCATKPTPYCQASDAGDADSCSIAELAAFDLFSIACGDWGAGEANSGVIGSLPNGQMTIDCDDSPCTPTSTYTLNVAWSENQRLTTDLDDTVVRRVQMRMRP